MKESYKLVNVPDGLLHFFLLQSTIAYIGGCHRAAEPLKWRTTRAVIADHASIRFRFPDGSYESNRVKTKLVA